jgi:DNA-binding beta-propeller fold protein YncE
VRAAFAFAAIAATAAAAAAGAPCVVDLRPRSEIPGANAWGLESPEAIAVDHRGDVLIADTGNHRVVVVAATGEVLTEFGGFGWGDGQFDRPSGLAVYTGFFIYVLDEGNRRVQRFDVDGDFLDVLVGTDEAGSPVDLAVGQAGGVLLVDADSQTILVRSQFAERLAPIGRFGSGEGGLVRPRAVAWGPDREVAVSDPGRSVVEVFDEFGTELYSLTCADTLGPGDLLFDPSGSLIVSDLRHGRVVAFPPGGGPPSASFGGAASLTPTALALDRDGELLVLDGERRRILSIEIVHGKCPSDR